MIRIGVVDDHTIVRSGLIQYLSEQVDMQVVGEAASGREAIDLVRHTDMDVMLLDLAMEDQSGLDAIEMILAKAPDINILVLSAYPEEHYAIHLIRRGAKGYLNKTCEPDDILQAIRMVSKGKRYVSASVAQLLMEQLGQTSTELPHEQLSEREFQVFLKLASGHSNGSIAEELSLSIKTVSTYRTRLSQKMGLDTNSDLTYYALKHKLID